MTDLVQAAEGNLRFLLAPIQRVLDDPSLTDLQINGPGGGRSFADFGQGLRPLAVPYDLDDLDDIAINAAALTRQDIAEDVPLVNTRFPGGHRVQIIRPPACVDGQYSFSIRRPSAQTWTLEELERAGVFAKAVASEKADNPNLDRLLGLYRAERWREFLALAVQSRLNIVFTGTVGSGKTHNMRACTHAIPPGWRIVTVEDTQELINLPCRNVVNLLYSKGGQSAAKVTAADLVQAGMRMGMNGLLVQELRDEAAYAYLYVLMSGHWGMTTTHAESAEDAFGRIAALVRQHPSGMTMDQADLLATLHRCIHVVVHCVRDSDGSRRVAQVYWQPGLKG